MLNLCVIIKRMRILWCLITIWCFCITSAQAAEPAIRVGILSNQHNISISSDTVFSILNELTGEKLGRFNAKEKINITVKSKNLIVNGKETNAQEVLIKKEPSSGESFIEVNKRKYRGIIKVNLTQGKNSLTVVNILPVEQYLYGVIAKEISPEWPIESVKAQAVAARSYALANVNKHEKDGYDVCATTDCQVYWGKDSEAPGALKAVQDTYGQVLMYQGKIVPAYFHASSGGYTENSENVWGSYSVYMRGVSDYDQKSPYYRWEKSFLPREITELLNKSGYNIGVLKGIDVSPLTAPPMTAADRGVSGRVKLIRFIGSLGTAEIKGGENLRRILGLRSSLVDFQIIMPVQPSLDIGIIDRTGNYETKSLEINVPPIKKKEFLKEKDTLRRLSGREGETVLITGFGWGHGLGLSQWGAKAMAEQAKAGDTTYFKEILKHYYKGVSVQKVY